MDHDAVGALDQAEVLLALQDKGHGVLEVEDVRSVPVGNVVDVALGGSGSDQVSPTDRHVDHSVLEVQVLLEVHVFREDVRDFDAVLVVEVGFPVAVGYLLVHHLSKNHIAVPAGPSTHRAVGRPGQLFDRTVFQLAEGVGPARLVANFEHAEGAHCEVVAVGTPADRVDHVVVGRGGVEQSS